MEVGLCCQVLGTERLGTRLVWEELIECQGGICMVMIV